jgi:hypothetical protein
MAEAVKFVNCLQRTRKIVATFFIVLLFLSFFVVFVFNKIE